MRRLSRDLSQRVLGGVCAGVANRLGVDPLVVRVVVVASTLVGGIGFALYALAWLAMPAAEGAGPAAPRRAAIPRRGSVEVAAGAGLLILSLLITIRQIGLPFSDALVWPLVLVAAGGALLWRQSATAEPGAAADEPDAPADREEVVRERAAVASRTGVGIALVIAAGLVFLQTTGALSAARDVLLAVFVAVVVLGVIFAPWIVRMARSLTAERRERIRSQERAEVAAHLHDSVLQTLALVQRRAQSPSEVAALARRQERELRAWLSERPESARGERRLAAALQDAAEEVEVAHGATVEVVAVGDRDLDEPAEALVAAAREAMVNSAKFGAGSPIAVYAEVADDGVRAFVRDRGPGFDPSAVPEDRRGVRESIVGRMKRHGGSARIVSGPGEGTEVELTV